MALIVANVRVEQRNTYLAGVVCLEWVNGRDGKGREGKLVSVRDLPPLPASNFPEAASGALQYQLAQDCHGLEAQRATLGTDHCAVGGLIAEHWHFAPAIVEAIAGHHEPPATGTADVVHVADNMAHALDLSLLEQELVPPLSMSAWMRLGQDEAQCRKIFQQVETEHEAGRPTVHVAADMARGGLDVSPTPSPCVFTGPLASDVRRPLPMQVVGNDTRR